MQYMLLVGEVEEATQGIEGVNVEAIIEINRVTEIVGKVLPTEDSII